MAVAALDDAIWSWLTRELADEDRVRWHLTQMQRDDAGADDLATIDRHLAQIGRQQTNLAQAVATMGDNPDGVAPLLAQLDALGKQRRAAEQDRADVLARQAQQAAVAAQVRDLQERCRAIAAQMAHGHRLRGPAEDDRRARGAGDPLSRHAQPPLDGDEHHHPGRHHERQGVACISTHECQSKLPKKAGCRSRWLEYRPRPRDVEVRRVGILPNRAPGSPLDVLPGALAQHRLAAR